MSIDARGNGYEPRFDRDYTYGRQGELLVDDYLRWVAQGDARVEVKRKRYVDVELYVEHEHDPGRTGRYVPSGIAVTKAEVWAYNIDETGIVIFVPCDRLREAAAHRLAHDAETKDGSCPTRGRLVHVGLLTYLESERRGAA